MNAIGFRAEKDSIHWAVVSGAGENAILQDHGEIKAPKTYKSDAEVLAYFRTKLCEAIGRFKPTAAGIRYPETGGKTPRYLASMYSRCRVEGVIAECLGTHKVTLVSGALNTLGAKLKSSAPKAYIDPASDEVRGVKFAKKASEHREAVLVAVAAMETKHGSNS